MLEIGNKRYDVAVDLTVFLLLLLFIINLLFCLFEYELGNGFKTVFFGPGDMYADLIKVAMSYKWALNDIEHSKEFLSWPQLYKSFLLSNPYGGEDSLVNGTLTHFHLPPFSSLIFIVCAYLIGIIKSPDYVIVLYLFAYVLLVVLFLYRSILGGRLMVRVNQVRKTLVIFALFIVSYPVLFMFVRGNYNAGFTSLLIGLYFVPLIYRRAFGVADAFFIAMAINIRPNAAILLMALPLIYGFRGSVFPVLNVVFVALCLFFASLFLVHYIYPGYDLNSFMGGVRIYDNMYVKTAEGDSIYLFVEGVYRYLGVADKMTIVYRIGILFILLLPLLILMYYYFRVGEYEDYMLPFACLSIYRIMTPVFSEYHLIVYAIPLCTMLYDYKERVGWDKYLYYCVLLLSVFMLSPKKYYISADNLVRLIVVNADSIIMYISMIIILVVSVKVKSDNSNGYSYIVT